MELSLECITSMPFTSSEVVWPKNETMLILLALATATRHFDGISTAQRKSSLCVDAGADVDLDRERLSSRHVRKHVQPVIVGNPDADADADDVAADAACRILAERVAEFVLCGDGARENKSPRTRTHASKNSRNAKAKARKRSRARKR